MSPSEPGRRTPRATRKPRAGGKAPATAAPATPAATTPEALAAWLPGRRWFAGPSAGVISVSLSTVALPVSGLAVGLVDTDAGDRYQLLVPDPPARPDVADDPAAADALARWIAGSARSAPTDAGTVTGHWPAATDRLGAATARPLGGEQSNTSVVIGGTHVLKVFRRLRAGPHPEIEIGRHLAGAAEAGWPAPVARLTGWYELEAPDAAGSSSATPGATALGVVQELVPGALDAWGLVLSALAGDPGGLLPRLHDLGRDLAALHGALARPAPGASAGSADPAPEAFGTVPLERAQLAALAASVAEDAARLLPGREPATDEPVAPALAALAGRAPEVAARAEALVAEVGDDLGAAIRHHGDLHLGQVVLGADGWVILDFEGEPARPLDERRRRHAPLRDVAGMLRSFAYAAATHGRTHGSRLSPGWEPAARAAFLDGYLATVDPGLLPGSPVATRALLTLLELEKVVYEIGYEVAHRPDWVGLPVDGLRRLLDGGPR